MVFIDFEPTERLISTMGKGIYSVNVEAHDSLYREFAGRDGSLFYAKRGNQKAENPCKERRIKQQLQVWLFIMGKVLRG